MEYPMIAPEGTRYVVTGVDYHGKRFNAMKTVHLRYALAINLYRGTVWYENENDERTMIRRTFN